MRTPPVLVRLIPPRVKGGKIESTEQIYSHPQLAAEHVITDKLLPLSPPQLAAIGKLLPPGSPKDGVMKIQIVSTRRRFPLRLKAHRRLPRGRSALRRTTSIDWPS